MYIWYTVTKTSYVAIRTSNENNLFLSFFFTLLLFIYIFRRLLSNYFAFNNLCLYFDSKTASFYINWEWRLKLWIFFVQLKVQVCKKLIYHHETYDLLESGLLIFFCSLTQNKLSHEWSKSDTTHLPTHRGGSSTFRKRYIMTNDPLPETSRHKIPIKKLYP